MQYFVSDLLSTNFDSFSQNNIGKQRYCKTKSENFFKKRQELMRNWQ